MPLILPSPHWSSTTSSSAVTSALAPTEIAAMLAAIGADSLDQLIDQTVPAAIRLPADLPLPAPKREHEALADLKAIAGKNVVNKSCIGMGYYDTLTPKVILRNVMENPGWYTAYTPYQAEIAQGRLEALLNYPADGDRPDRAGNRQRLAARRSHRCRRSDDHGAPRFQVEVEPFSGRRRLLPADHRRRQDPRRLFRLRTGRCCGQPETTKNSSAPCSSTRTTTAKSATSPPIAAASRPRARRRRRHRPDGAGPAQVAPAPWAPTSPSARRQRFGIPMGFGGPHAAFFATREALSARCRAASSAFPRTRAATTALRMALQTREQHIRREKANSNICTSQVLLANMAGMYAVYHGPQGLRTIAGRIHRLTAILAEGLKRAGVNLTQQFFDTLQLDLGARAKPSIRAALTAGYNLRRVSATACSASRSTKPPPRRCRRPVQADRRQTTLDIEALDAQMSRSASPNLPAALLRSDAILQHPVFNTHHTEHEMLRYLKSLQNKDLALDHSMISLGSCTMKLNATSEMIPVTWPEFGGIHPFAPRDQARLPGNDRQLTEWLKTVTGFDAICMQPNSGAQGEYAGLVAIAATTPAAAKPPQRLPDPQIGARHQPGDRPDVRHAGRRGRLRRQRQRRRRRPQGQGRSSTRPPGLPDDHLPVDARRVRGSGRDICAIVHATAARCTWTAPTSTPRSA
jgi:glycine dehydrogenase